jgi:hypothetical protein
VNSCSANSSDALTADAAVIGCAASEATTIDADTIRKRNAELEVRLKAAGLHPIDVCGDGNCFFRALSVCLTGSENGHQKLRKDIVQHMAHECGLTDNPEQESEASLRQYLNYISRDGKYVGEDVVKAASSFLRRVVYIYTGTGNDWPCAYHPTMRKSLPQASPVALAFYEPGHYRAALKASDVEVRSPAALGNPHDLGNGQPPVNHLTR